MKFFQVDKIKDDFVKKENNYSSVAPAESIKNPSFISNNLIIFQNSLLDR